MYTEEQVLAQFRRNLLGALFFIILLGVGAVALLAAPGSLPRGAGMLMPTVLVPVLAALGMPLQRMRRADPDLVQRLRQDEWRAIGLTLAWRNGLLTALGALPLLAFVITTLALPNGVPLLATVTCTLAVGAVLLTILWHDRA